MEGFDHVVIRAARECIDHVARRSVGREEEDGQGAEFFSTNQSTEFDAGHFGQVPIEHEQVEATLFHGSKSFFGAFFGGDDKVHGGEHRCDDSANVGIIIDEEDARATTNARRPRGGLGCFDFVVGWL